jgi:hypothetical protein
MINTSENIKGNAIEVIEYRSSIVNTYIFVMFDLNK